MAAPRKISDAGYQRLLQVALARRQLPTDAELAAEYGCTVRGVRDAMRRLLLSVTTVTGEIDLRSIAGHPPSSAGPAPAPCPGSRNPSKRPTS